MSPFGKTGLENKNGWVPKEMMVLSQGTESNYVFYGHLKTSRYLEFLSSFVPE